MHFYHSVAIQIETVRSISLKKDFKHPGGCEQEPFVLNSA